MTDKQLMKPFSMSELAGRATLAFALAVLSLFVLTPELVWAAPPWEAGVDKAVISVKSMLYGVAFIAVVVVGVLSFRGRIPWGYAIAVFAGLIMMFGADQIITWARP